MYLALVILGFLIMPQLSFADAIAPMTNLFTSDTAPSAAIVLVIIIFVEAYFLRRLVKTVSYKTSLWRSTLINLLSSAVGSFAYFVDYASKPDYNFMPTDFKILIPLFLLTLIVETPLLVFLYRKEVSGWWRITMISVKINLASYLSIFLLEIVYVIILINFVHPR